MKVNHKNKLNVPFCTLGAGSCFVFEGTTFIKTPRMDIFNCVSMLDGGHHFIESSENVLAKPNAVVNLEGNE